MAGASVLEMDSQAAAVETPAGCHRRLSNLPDSEDSVQESHTGTVFEKIQKAGI